MDESPRYVVIEEVNALANVVVSADLKKLVSAWVDAAPHEKLAIAEALSPMLGSDRRLELRAETNETERPDLRTLGGRAKWALEEILRLDLSPARGEDQMESSLSAARIVGQAIASYRLALIDSARSTDKLDMVNLREKYKQSLQGRSRAAALAQLLRSWGPIGRKMPELIDISGAPFEKVGEDFVCKYDNDLDGTAFKCIVKDGLIVSVIVSSYD